MPRSFLTSTLYRVPLWLRSLGIRGYERVLGVEWLVLTTHGRRTHHEHSVMLDVVGHDEPTDTYYVQPADGRKSNWLKNVLEDPSPTIEIHGHTTRVTATDITGARGADVVLRFIRAHPLYARLIVWLVGYVESVDHPDDELRNRLETVPVIALRAWPPGGRGQAGGGA
jgi:deazaflavin-dependent oxidoreductase (nitroreductase family)